MEFVCVYWQTQNPKAPEVEYFHRWEGMVLRKECK